jgi:glycosyltransferase involved in cell wall biosynthesis
LKDWGYPQYVQAFPMADPLHAPPPQQPCVSVVIPAYNEAATIQKTLERVLAHPLVQEIIVVDDCSSDDTSAVVQSLAQPQIILERHAVNQGKGAALRTGFAKASAPIVMIQDADLEYDPEDYADVLQPIMQGKAAVSYGSRFAGGRPHRVLYYWHMLGNRFLTLLSNMFTNLNLTDMETGMKAFRLEVVKQIHIQENRFGFEPEITAKVAKLGVPIYEVPISYNGRTYAEGKKIGWKDGVSAIRCILKYYFAA